MKGNTSLFSSTGRIPRSKYWSLTAGFYVVVAAIGILTGAFAPQEDAVEVSQTVEVIGGLVFLFLALIALMAQIRRWHDRDKSGWWVLINLVPCIGGLWAFIELGFLPGTRGDNEYGPDPLE